MAADNDMVEFQYYPGHESIKSIGLPLTKLKCKRSDMARLISSMKSYGYTARNQSWKKIDAVGPGERAVMFAVEGPQAHPCVQPPKAADIMKLLFVDSVPFNADGSRLNTGTRMVGFSYAHIEFGCLYAAIRTYIESDEGLEILQAVVMDQGPSLDRAAVGAWATRRVSMSGAPTVRGADSNVAPDTLVVTPRMFSPIAVFFPLIASGLDPAVEAACGGAGDELRVDSFIDSMYDRDSPAYESDAFNAGDRKFFAHCVVSPLPLDSTWHNGLFVKRQEIRQMHAAKLAASVASPAAAPPSVPAVPRGRRLVSEAHSVAVEAVAVASAESSALVRLLPSAVAPPGVPPDPLAVVPAGGAGREVSVARGRVPAGAGAVAAQTTEVTVASEDRAEWTKRDAELVCLLRNFGAETGYKAKNDLRFALTNAVAETQVRDASILSDVKRGEDEFNRMIPALTKQSRFRQAAELITAARKVAPHGRWDGAADLTVVIVPPRCTDACAQMVSGVTDDQNPCVAVYAATGVATVAATLVLDYTLCSTAFDKATECAYAPVGVPCDGLAPGYGRLAACCSFATSVLQLRAMHLLLAVAEECQWSRYRTSRNLTRRLDFAHWEWYALEEKVNPVEWITVNLVARASNCIVLLAFDAHQQAARKHVAKSANAAALDPSASERKDILDAVRSTCYAYACYVFRDRIADVISRSWLGQTVDLTSGPVGVLRALLSDACDPRVLELAAYGTGIRNVAETNTIPQKFDELVDGEESRYLDNVLRVLTADIRNLAFGGDGPMRVQHTAVQFHTALLDAFASVSMETDPSTKACRHPLVEVLLQPRAPSCAVRMCLRHPTAPCHVEELIPTTYLMDMATVNNTDVQPEQGIADGKWAPDFDALFSVRAEVTIRPNAEDAKGLAHKTAVRRAQVQWGDCFRLGIMEESGDGTLLAQERYMCTVSHAGFKSQFCKVAPANKVVSIISNGRPTARVVDIAPFVAIVHLEEKVWQQVFFQLSGVVTCDWQGRWSCNNGWNAGGKTDWYEETGRLILSDSTAPSADANSGALRSTASGRIFFYRRVASASDQKRIGARASVEREIFAEGVLRVEAQRRPTDTQTFNESPLASIIYVGPLEHNHPASACAGEVKHVHREFCDPASVLHKKVRGMVEGESTATKNMRNCVNAMPLPSDGFHPTVSALVPQETDVPASEVWGQLMKRARTGERA